MGTPETIKIDDVEYVRRDLHEQAPSGDRHIVVLQRGFIFVGNLDKSNAPEFVLTDAYNVRRWGTSSGLGELADKGPLTNTKLDKATAVKFHELTVVLMIPCNESNWKKIGV